MQIRNYKSVEHITVVLGRGVLINDYKIKELKWLALGIINGLSAYQRMSFKKSFKDKLKESGFFTGMDCMVGYRLECTIVVIDRSSKPKQYEIEISKKAVIHEMVKV